MLIDHLAAFAALIGGAGDVGSGVTSNLVKKVLEVTPAKPMVRCSSSPSRRLSQ